MNSVPIYNGVKQICAETNRPVNKIKDAFSLFGQPEDKYVVKQAISKDGDAIDI
jgi:hypothetical protein